MLSLLTTGLGWTAAGLTLLSFFMKTMIPLRTLAIAANVVFIVYAGLAEAWHVLTLHAVLLPFNAVRLIEMKRLTAKVRKASTGDLNMNWLKPFMKRRLVKKNEILFRKGDVADAMYITVSGQYRLAEIDQAVLPGQVIGEVGLIAPDNRRTLTFECSGDGELLVINYAHVKQLYFQNPEFGFFLLQLTSQRLFQDIRRLEEKVAQAASQMS